MAFKESRKMALVGKARVLRDVRQRNRPVFDELARAPNANVADVLTDRFSIRPFEGVGNVARCAIDPQRDCCKRRGMRILVLKPIAHLPQPYATRQAALAA